MFCRFGRWWLLAVSLVASALAGATTAEEPPPDPAEIEALARTLEDPDQRARLIESLRLLAKAQEDETADADIQTVKTAATELVELAADKVETVARSGSLIADTLLALPAMIGEGISALRDPGARERWLGVGGRLAAALGAGFLAAALVGLGIRQLRRRRNVAFELPLLRRALRLALHLLVDLVPIAVFALVAYGVLAVVDPQRQARLVAVALINASILTRLVQIVSAFLFAPERPELRLWGIGDETAQYIHHWLKRLSIITVYGYFGLQASVLLGLSGGAYQALLRLLGLAILALMLVLIAQNRRDVARAIAGEPTEGESPRQLSALRRGLGRVWHLLAAFYLVTVFVIWTVSVEDGAQFVFKGTVVTLAVVAVLQLLLHATERLFERGIRLPGNLHRQYPNLERRLNRYFPALRRLVKVALTVLAVLVIADAWGIDALAWASGGTGRDLLGGIFNIVLIVGIALLVWEFASGGIERYLADADAQGRVRARSARLRTLLTVARNALLVVVTVVATLMVLSELGINIAPLLAGAGVVGLAIGFGAQRLVQDVINGAFILFQDLMSVGDVVVLGDKSGLVEALSIRTVRLRDLAGVVHTIPFSTIDSVSNLTREFSFHVFDLGIAYRENVDEVIALLHEIGKELQADPEVGPLVLEPLEVFGLDAFGDSAIVIKGRIKTQPIKQWQVGRAFNRLVKKRFDEKGIEIPFPHTTLYFGQDKQGKAPPAFVQMEALLRDAGGGRAGSGSG